MRNYLDTNVILSAIFKKEPLHNEAMTLLNQNSIEFISGPITLVELQLRIADMWRNKSIEIDNEVSDSIAKLSVPQQIRAIVEIYPLPFKIEFYSMNIQESLTFNDWIITFDSNMTLAFRFAPQMVLRLLDLIQIASAMNIKLLSRQSVDYFVTNDSKILDNVLIIQQLTGFIPISSKSILSLLQIEPSSEYLQEEDK